MTVSLTAAMVTGLFGSGSADSSSQANVTTAIPALRRATASGAEAKGMTQQQKDAATIRALNQFSKAIASAKDLKSALRDPRVLGVLLPALGLADQVTQPGLAQQTLSSDPSDPKSLVSRLADSRWTAATKTLGLAASGLAGLQDTNTLTTIKNNYVRYQYRKGLDSTQPGISDALYFEEKVSASTNVYTVLGDPVLRRVVTGALGLPVQMAIQPVETQAGAITSRLNLTATFNDPASVQKLAERYVMSAAQSAASSTAPATGILALFA